MDYNKRNPNKVRGASTISQQVAKNVFLWQGRSKLRKAIETYFTFMIELVWSKERILEMYLNVAETGKGIFGIEAASQEMFKKPAKKLTRRESALIASSLPNPKVFTVSPMSRYVAEKYPRVMRGMHNLEKDPDILEHVQSMQGGEKIISYARERAGHVESMLGDEFDLLTADRRYGYINGIVRQSLQRPLIDRLTLTDRIDNIVTHKWLGLPVFFAVMYIVF